MIKSNELRLGNWAYMFGLKAKVKTIDKDIEELGIEPIQLTEEILLKCGFKKSSEDLENDNIDYILNNCEYWIQHHEDVNNFIFFGGGNSLGIKLNYLHQLQNLYFALTNEELTITL